VLGVALEEGDDLVAAGEGIGLAGERQSRQADQAVWKLECQRIPALGAPAFGDAPAFEHDVLAADAAQVMAHDQPSLAAANHDRVVEFAHPSLSSLRPENALERPGNRCSIRVGCGALAQEDSALRSASGSPVQLCLPSANDSTWRRSTPTLSHEPTTEVREREKLERRSGRGDQTPRRPDGGE